MIEGDLALVELEAEMLTPLGTAPAALSLGPALALEAARGGAVASVPTNRRPLGSHALTAAAFMVAAAALGYTARRAREPMAPPALATAIVRSVAPPPSVPAEAPVSPVSLPPAPQVAPLPPSPAPPPAPPRAAEPKAAYIAVELEHAIRGGRLRLWIDDTLRLDQALDRDAGKRSTAGEVFDVAPGVHDVAVEVRWDRNVRAARVKATFLPDENRRLTARLGGVFKKKMVLQWRDVEPSAPRAAASR